MRGSILTGLVFGAALLGLLGARAVAEEPFDPADQSHVSLEAVTRALEKSGYKDVVNVDLNEFDAFLRLEATNPQGKRVNLVLDNTTGSILIERPVGG